MTRRPFSAVHSASGAGPVNGDGAAVPSAVSNASMPNVCGPISNASLQTANGTLLIVTLVVTPLLPFDSVPLLSYISYPVYFMFVNFNIFLMIVALLPIGPFDGHAAWQVIPRVRARLKRRKPKARPALPPEPVVTLTPEEQREADELSEKEAASLMARLTRKSGEPTQDR